jgi:hypothetical protein
MGHLDRQELKARRKEQRRERREEGKIAQIRRFFLHRGNNKFNVGTDYDTYVAQLKSQDWNCAYPECEKKLIRQPGAYADDNNIYCRRHYKILYPMSEPTSPSMETPPSLAEE